MKTTVRVLCFFVLSLTNIDSSLAESNKLLGMSNSKKEGMNRISLIFDRIPQFEVEHSGQRIRVVLSRTSFARTFRKIPGDEMLAPLFRLETVENAEQCAVELYFRKIPQNLDVSVDEQTASIMVNVFWNGSGSEVRPGIMGERFGRLQPIKGGGVVQKVTSSRYSGNWLNFFKDFEWPPEVRAPLRFSFPPFPSPIIAEHAALLPREVLDAAKEEAWSLAAARLKENTNIGENSLPLMRVELLLRAGDADGALAALGRIEPVAGEEWVNCWKTYFKSYALAVSGRYYQAGNHLAEGSERCSTGNGLKPWYRILDAEINLAANRADKALAALTREKSAGASLALIEATRTADALYQLGSFEKAYAGYSVAASDMAMLREYPSSMANWSAALYAKKEFARAADHYFSLSDELRNGFPEAHALAFYWSAMARLREGNNERARLMFSKCREKFKGTEAGFRAWLKLIDLDMLSESKPPMHEILAEYDVIIADGPSRKLREEAFFKRILACHLLGDDFRAVEHLGRFFDDYWAGDLYPEAQALLIELLPEVIGKLVKQQAFVPALALVTRHRDLLAQAPITCDFLRSLAESYLQAELLEQAAVTYLYILDFEKTGEKKKEVFLPLIRLYARQKKYEQVLEYASTCLKTYPEESGNAQILYYHAEALFRTGDVEAAVRLLHENKRPETPELDTLTGDVFFETGKYEQAEYYYGRAAAADGGTDPEIRFQRAEAYFRVQAWGEAAPLYETLLEEPRFSGQAGYRLIQISYEKGQHGDALNLYNKLTEMNVERQWLELANETIRIQDALNGGY